MLLCHHGASTLGPMLSRPMQRKMTSYSGVTTLALDAMMSVLRTPAHRTASTLPNSTPSDRTQVWNPSHGIIFAGVPRPAAEAPGIFRTLTTSSSTSIDRDLYQTTSYEESPTSSDLKQPEQKSFHSVTTGSGEDDSSWVPSTTTESQEEKDQSHEGESQKAEIASVEELPETPPTLKYHIPADVLKEAKAAEAGTPASFWSYRMFSGPENQKVKVHYCKSKHTTERVLEQYFQGKTVLGFDIEWKPEATRHMSIKKNVALIQLACEERIALFHLALFPKDDIEGLVAPTLKKIMEDPEITKVGVAIKADCTRLRKYLDIDSKGLFELSHLYRLVKYSPSGDYKLINKKLVGLAVQVQDVLKFPLFKGEVVRGSDWSQALDVEQIFYAASDSYAGLILYHVLDEQRQKLDPSPPRPYHAELGLPIRLADNFIIPTDATADEAEEPEPENDPPTVNLKLPKPNIDASEVELEDEKDTLTSKSATPSSKPKQKHVIPSSQAYTDAETWATSYRASHPVRPGAPSWSYSGPAALRAYALWHQNNLDVPTIASTVRDPPIKESTVSTYILEAIRIEKLPYDKDRLRAVLEALPKFTRDNWRYKALWALVATDET